MTLDRDLYDTLRDLELVERMPHRQLKLVAGQIAGDSGHERP